MNRFSLSGPREEVLAYFGFTAANVVDKAQDLLWGQPDAIGEKQVEF